MAGQPHTLRVLHVVDQWLPLTETWLHTQAASVPDDVEWGVLCNDVANLSRFPVSQLHCLADIPLWKRRLNRAARRFLWSGHLPWAVRILRSGGYDLVHSHFANVAWHFSGTVRRAHLPHVVSFYGYDVSFLLRHDPAWLERYAELFAHVQAVLCEGPHMACSIASLGCPETRIHVHHLGIPVSRIPFRPLPFETGGPLRVLLASSFREKKGIPIALEALGRLAASEPVEITLIGEANDEPRNQAEKRKILDGIERYELAGRVRLVGFQPHDRVLREGRKHHLFLAPSIMASDGDCEGGAPVVLLDMAASGTLLIGSGHCDIPQIVRHRETGLVAEEGSVDDLEHQLRWALANPGRWQEMRAAARRLVEEEYDSAVQGRRLAALYRDLCAAPRGFQG